MADLDCAVSCQLLSLSSNKHTYADPVIFASSQCLQSLHAIEHVWTPTVNYFENNRQSELKPYMRKMVVDWLLEVCKEQRCEDEVFPVAVNLIDRFLAVEAIPKTEFQLLASACLLVASKLREKKSLPAEKICKYTANSITLDQLYDCEMFVLERLNWDLGTITAHELSDHLMYQLFDDPSAPISQRIRRHMRALLDLSLTDFTFALQRPSLLAASAILSSLSHFGFITDNFIDAYGDNVIYHQISDLVGVDADRLADWSVQLTRLRNEFIARHEIKSPASPSETPSSPAANIPYISSINSEISSPVVTSNANDNTDKQINANNKQAESMSLLPTTPLRSSNDDNGEEQVANNPRRDIPLSIALSLAVCAIAYCVVRHCCARKCHISIFFGN